MFLQNASVSEDQMWVAKRNTQILTGNTQPFSLGYKYLALLNLTSWEVVGGWGMDKKTKTRDKDMGQTPGTMRAFNRFSYSTFQLNAKQSPYQNKSKNNTDNK